MNESHVTGFEVAPEASVKLNTGMYDVSRMGMEIWQSGMNRDCADPMYLTQTNTDVFEQDNNKVEAYGYAELIGSGLWHKKDENENVQQGAARLGKIVTVYPCDFAKDLVITRQFQRLNMQDGGRTVKMMLKDFIDKARKTDMLSALSLITDSGLYSAAVPVATGETFSTLVTVNGVAANTVPTPAQIESGVEAAELAFMSQLDEDGFGVTCTGTKVVIVSKELFIPTSKALAIRSDNCCGPNGQQLASVRGLKLYSNPEIPAGTFLLVSSEAHFVRDIVDPLTVDYVDPKYNDAHKAIFRGYYAHRYYKRGKHGAIKVEFKP